MNQRRVWLSQFQIHPELGFERNERVDHWQEYSDISEVCLVTVVIINYAVHFLSVLLIWRLPGVKLEER